MQLAYHPQFHLQLYNQQKYMFGSVKTVSEYALHKNFIHKWSSGVISERSMGRHTRALSSHNTPVPQE